MLTRYIYVRFTRALMHSWSAAPQHRAYLRGLHRHLFHFQVKVEVFHNDRELEFHDTLAEISQHFDLQHATMSDVGSCEAMAERLIAFVRSCYGERRIIVDVSEDGENGAILRYVPSP